MKILDNILAFDFVKAVTDEFDSKMEYGQRIEDLNREQMQTGIDGKGQVLRTYNAVAPNFYSYRTIGIKGVKGQPVNAVTLYDTGEFYRSVVSEFDGTGLKIESNSKKTDGDIDDNVDLSAIHILNPENMSKAVNEVFIPMSLIAVRKGYGLPV